MPLPRNRRPLLLALAQDSREVQARLRGLATEPQPPRALDQIAAVLRSDFEKYRQVILASGITAD